MRKQAHPLPPHPISHFGFERKTAGFYMSQCDSFLETRSSPDPLPYITDMISVSLTVFRVGFYGKVNPSTMLLLYM